jgi:hypothetical protein
MISSAAPSRNKNRILSRHAGLLLLLMASVGIAGCATKGYEAPVLDTPKARETLTSVLEDWKNGETPEALQKRTPPIVVQDIDWTSGAKLVKYELSGDGNEAEGSLVTQVKLTLQPSRGGPKEKTVTYIVGTSPGLTVLRDIMR